MYRKYYEILGLDDGATLEQVKEAYGKLAQKYHPDVCPNKEDAEIKMRDINQAYSLILKHLLEKQKQSPQSSNENQEIDFDNDPKYAWLKCEQIPRHIDNKIRAWENPYYPTSKRRFRISWTPIIGSFLICFTVLISILAVIYDDKIQLEENYSETSASGTEQEKQAENESLKQIDKLVKEISEYDIIYFGELHQERNFKETSTLEDFVELFLPRLANKNLVKNPYEFIRSEFLPSELDKTGRQIISQKELDNLDKNGIVTVKQTPTFYKELFQYRDSKDRGIKKSLKKGTELGFKVRGLLPSVSQFRAMRKTAKRLAISSLDSEEDIYFDMIDKAVTDNYLQRTRQHMKNKQRAIFYGGCLHNDYKDIYSLGIADEIEKEFPGKHASVDLINSSLEDADNPYFKYYRSILKSRGYTPKSLDKILIVKPETNKVADYVVFLPERAKLEIK